MILAPVVIQKRCAWSWIDEARCWLYAADVRTLAQIVRRPATRQGWFTTTITESAR